MKRLNRSAVAVDLGEWDKGVQGQGRSDEKAGQGHTSFDTSCTCKSLKAVRSTAPTRTENRLWHEHKNVNVVIQNKTKKLDADFDADCNAASIRFYLVCYTDNNIQKHVWWAL